MKKRLTIDPGAALLLGLLLFALDWRELAALLCAVTAHELGHLIALVLIGVPVRGLALTLSGPVLRCNVPQSKGKGILSAFAGPASGLFFGAALRRSWSLCADVSLLLSIVNLLPVLPLDGGRALAAILPNKWHVLLSVLGVLIPCVLMLLGLFAVRTGYGPGLAAFGGWLLILTCQGDGIDVE